jgi:hypothetical protein|tara:strand:- start:12454 stop:12627 length:174 start_codon:yes stop_codon:yes gene_type:complete
MPIKFKSGVKNAKTGAVQNYYMQSTPVDVLKEALESSSTMPKKKQKIRNELVKRGVL